MNPKIRVASIGLGGVAVRRNLPYMKQSPDYEIVGVIDRNAGKAEQIAKQFGCPFSACADSLEGLPWLKDVDAITVGTGPQSHYALIKAALLMGKDVITEKPFTMTVAEGEELVRIARERKRILAIVHNFQFAGSTLKLMEDIKQGRLGKIKAVAARQLSNPRRKLPPWYEELPLGLFYDESPHFFYLIGCAAPGHLQFLTSEVFPSTTGKKTPAAIHIQYKCESRDSGIVPVTIDMNFEATISEWHLTVFGEDFLGDVDIFRDIYLRIPNDGLHTTGTVLRTSALATLQHWAQHFTSGIGHLKGTLVYGADEVFHRFAAAVRERKEPEGIGPEEALRVLKLQHQAIQDQKKLF